MSRTNQQARRGAKQLFRWCLVGGDLDEARARQVIAGILGSKRRGYLAVLEQFQRLVKLERAGHTASIESAALLPPDMQGRVRARLESSYGTRITTLFTLNPSLIGGMRIQVGSDVYDGSVQSRLAALRTSFGITEVNGKNG